MSKNLDDAARRLLREGKLSITGSVQRNEIDDAIDRAADEMLVKHPKKNPTPGQKLEKQMQRKSREYDTRDKIARQGSPMTIREETTK